MVATCRLRWMREGLALPPLRTGWSRLYGAGCGTASQVKEIGFLKQGAFFGEQALLYAPVPPSHPIPSHPIPFPAGMTRAHRRTHARFAAARSAKVPKGGYSMGFSTVRCSIGTPWAANTGQPSRVQVRDQTDSDG